jgi:hypothetical protein
LFLEISSITSYIASVNPEDALKLQIEKYRQMTGEERLVIALRLHELSCEVARSGIRWQNPSASEEEVEKLLRDRIALSRML